MIKVKELKGQEIPADLFKAHKRCRFYLTGAYVYVVPKNSQVGESRAVARIMRFSTAKYRVSNGTLLKVKIDDQGDQ